MSKQMYRWQICGAFGTPSLQKTFSVWSRLDRSDNFWAFVWPTWRIHCPQPCFRDFQVDFFNQLDHKSTTGERGVEGDPAASLFPPLPLPQSPWSSFPWSPLYRLSCDSLTYLDPQSWAYWIRFLHVCIVKKMTESGFKFDVLKLLTTSPDSWAWLVDTVVLQVRGTDGTLLSFFLVVCCVPVDRVPSWTVS